jgi:hypothetical protein
MLSGLGTRLLCARDVSCRLRDVCIGSHVAPLPEFSPSEMAHRRLPATASTDSIASGKNPRSGLVFAVMPDLRCTRLWSFRVVSVNYL